MVTGVIVRQGILSGVNRKEYVDGRVSYIILRDCWCDIFVLNAHGLLEKKGDGKMECYYQKHERP
jgi:hypothetical protein